MLALSDDSEGEEKDDLCKLISYKEKNRKQLAVLKKKIKSLGNLMEKHPISNDENLVNLFKEASLQVIDKMFVIGI